MAANKLIKKNIKSVPNISPTDTSVSAVVYRIRAMEMLKMKIANHTYIEIGQHFDMHPDAVKNTLEWAIRQGMARQYENEIINDLVPEAIKVYKNKLNTDDGKEGDPYVAKDVLDKLLKLGDRFEMREQQQQETGLRAYLESKRLDIQQSQQSQPTSVNPSVTVRNNEHRQSAQQQVIDAVVIVKTNPTTNTSDAPATDPRSTDVPATTGISLTEGGEAYSVTMSSEDCIQKEFQRSLQP